MPDPLAARIDVMRSRNGLMCQTIAKKKASVPDCMALIVCSGHTKALEIQRMSLFSPVQALYIYI